MKKLFVILMLLFISVINVSAEPYNSAGKSVGYFTSLHVVGSQTANVTTVNAATYDLLPTDFILNVTYTATGLVTSLTLLTAQVISGRLISIKDAGGNAATYPIIIDTEGSETIDGANTITINSNYGGVDIYCDGSNWLVQ